MSVISTETGPNVDAAGVTFRLPDPYRRLRSVRLVQQLGASAEQVEFGHHAGVWALRLDRASVDRMEYLFELEHPNGVRETITDPLNPLRVPGAFGDKSVIEFPGYQAPAWLDAAPTPSTVTELAISSVELATTVGGMLWAPDCLASDAPAPLLIANDGPEYARLADLTQYAGALIGGGGVAPFRMALLAPGDRNRWYAVNPSYARAMATEIVPALHEVAPTTCRIGMGASLGGLAMLHIHRLFPSLFIGLFLQSGSFFRPDLDPQERRFSRFGPVTRFVADVVSAVADPQPVPTVLTCGIIEENLDNNRLMATTLQSLGYPAELHEVRDVHNYTAWRDAFDPYLTGLLSAVAGGDRAT